MKKYPFFLLLCLILSTAFSQDGQNRLSLDKFKDFERTSDARISPDGDHILYSRRWVNLMDDKQETDLWIMNADGSKNRFFLHGSNGMWSPQGDRVAFTKEGEPDGTQIFVKYLGEEGDPTQITRLENSPSNMEWSPDGKHIAFTMHVKAKSALDLDIPSKPKGAKWTAAPYVTDQVNYRRDRVGYRQPGYRHIFVVSAEGGTARKITSGDWHHSGSLEWTPDSKQIIFSSLRVPEADYAYRQSNLYQVNILDGKIKQLTDRKGMESQAALSPDGKKIAFIGSIWSENFYHKRRLFVMDKDGQNVRNISDDLDRSPSSPRWKSDGSGVYISVDRDGTRNVFVADLKGKVNPVSEGNHMLTLTDMNLKGAVGVISSPNHPSDIVKVNLSNGELKPLTSVNEDWLFGVELGEVEEIRYPSADGLEIQGWIVKPPQFDASKKYPLLLRIHGGPHGMYNVGFNLNFQLHAADGYVVLYTNPRGSTGYGYDFANAIQNSYPGKDYDDLMTGVDAVIAKGYIDEERMYVYGGSGGGVLTAWVVGHTDRFAAASVNYPVIDWFSFVGTTDGIGWYHNFENLPWEDPSEHIKRSPLMYVGNVKTPTMLMCGVKDLRTPISQTEEYYQALKVQKVPTVMVRFNEEYHGTSSKPSNFLRTMGYLNSWFARYGGPGKKGKEGKSLR